MDDVYQYRCNKCKDTGQEEFVTVEGREFVMQCECLIENEKKRLLGALPPQQGFYATQNPGMEKESADYLRSCYHAIRNEFTGYPREAIREIYFYYGPNGTGKTTAACSIYALYVKMLAGIDYRLTPRYISQTEFGKISAAFDLNNFLYNSKEFELIRSNAARNPFLVIDDLLRINPGDPGEMALKTMFDGCPFIVITGNWSPNPEKEFFYGRHFPGTISSFLGGKRTHWVPFFGENLR